MSASDSDSGMEAGGSFANLLAPKCPTKSVLAKAAPKPAAAASKTKTTQSSSRSATSSTTASSQSKPTKKTDLKTSKRESMVVDGRAARLLSSLQTTTADIHTRIGTIVFDEAYVPNGLSRLGCDSADPVAKARQQLIAKLQGDIKGARFRVGNSTNKTMLKDVTANLDIAAEKVEEAANFIKVLRVGQPLPDDYIDAKQRLQEHGWDFGSAYVVKELQLKCQHFLTFQEYCKLCDLFLTTSPEAALTHIQIGVCQHQYPFIVAQHVCQSS